MKRALFILAGVVIVLAGVALAAPSFIDWGQYKPLIEEQAEAATGRALKVDGDISAQVLPYPALTVEGVRFANAAGGTEADMAKLERLQVSVALLPLLSGEIQFSTVRLEGADILLERYKDGTDNWTLTMGEAEDAAAEPAAEEAAPASSGSGPAISFDDVVIENTRIRYADHSAGTVEEVRVPDLAIAIGSLQGPFRAEGSVQARGLAFNADVAVATMEPGRSVPVTAEITNDEAGLRVLVSAALLGLEETPRINGKVAVDVENMARLMAALSGSAVQSDGPALALEVKSSIRASAEAVTLTDTEIDLGGEKLTGGFDLSLTDPMSIDMRLKGGSIDLDSLMPRLMTLASASAGAGGGADPAAGAGSAAQKDEAPFEIPASLTGAIDLSIDALTYNGEAVRNAVVQAAVAKGVVTLTKVGADLPAASKLSVTGSLKARSGKPYFSGAARASAPDMRGLLQFVGADVSAIAADKLKRFDAKVSLSGGPDGLNINPIAVSLDQMNLSGSAAVALGGARPSIKADLALNALDVDAYMPPATAGESASGDEKAASGGEAASSPFAALAALDADVAVRVGKLTYQGAQYSNVTLGLDLLNGADGAGRLDASAKMGGLSGAVRADYLANAKSLADAPLSLEASFKAASASDIARALGAADKAPPRHLDGPVSFTATINGNAAAADFAAQLKTAQGQLNLNGNMKDAMGQPQLALAMDASARAYRDFMWSLGLPYEKAAPVGPLNATAKVNGSLERIQISELKFSAGENSLNGTLDIDRSAARVRPMITADIQAGIMNFDALMPKGSDQKSVKEAQNNGGGSSGPPWSDEPLPMEALKAADADVKIQAKSFLGFGVLFENADIHMVLADGTARFEKFTGTLYGGDMNMDGSFGPQQSAGNENNGGGHVPVLDLVMSLKQADMGTMVYTLTGKKSVTGIMDASFNLKGAGATSRTLVKSLNGAAQIDGKDGAFIGFDASALVKAVRNIDDPGGFVSLLTTAMSGGQTPYNDLDVGFDIQNGVMTAKQARTELADAEMRLNGIIDLPRWLMDARADLIVQPDIPPVGMKFYGPLDAPQRKLDTDSIKRFAAEKAIASGMQKLFGGKQQPAPDTQPEPEVGPMEAEPQQEQQQQPEQQQPEQQQPQQPDPAELMRQLFKK